jgi:hypothetical protein
MFLRPVHNEKKALHEVLETGAVVSALLERSALSHALSAFIGPTAWTSSRASGNVYEYAEETSGDLLKSYKEE